MPAQPIQPRRLETGKRHASEAVSPNNQGIPEGGRLDPEWEVAPRQVKALLDANEDLVLIDCRTPQEHQTARLDGSVLIPMQEIGSRLDELETHAESRMVVFCHHGGRSLKVTAMLRQYGFKQVHSMAGGIDLWAVDVDSNVPRY